MPTPTNTIPSPGEGPRNSATGGAYNNNVIPSPGEAGRAAVVVPDIAPLGNVSNFVDYARGGFFIMDTDNAAGMKTLAMGAVLIMQATGGDPDAMAALNAHSCYFYQANPGNNTLSVLGLTDLTGKNVTGLKGRVFYTG